MKKYLVLFVLSLISVNIATTAYPSLDDGPADDEDPEVTYAYFNYDKYHQPLRQTDYAFYMNMIEEINPELASQLKEFKDITQQPALLRSTWSQSSYDLPNTRNAYPIFHIDPVIKEMSTEEQKNALSKIIEKYQADLERQKTALEKDQKVRDKILTIINSLAPELYAKIIEIDPTGAQHIIHGNKHIGTAVSVNLKTGLPLIELDPNFINEPAKDQTAIMAHEIGHYVSGHFHTPDLSHKQLTTKDHPINDPIYRSDKLLFECAFEDAFQRIQEYEADAFSVVVLDADIDAAIARMQKHAQEEAKTIEEIKQLIKDQPELKRNLPHTFTRTHPFSKERAAQFESLRAELDLQKAHNTPRTRIDWDALITQYKGKTWEQLDKEL